MKSLTISSFLVASAMTVFSAIFTLQPAGAKPQAVGFFCGQSKGVPTTFAQTPRGKVPVIRWTSNVFKESGFDNQTRCKIISQRFQNYYQRQQLNYLTTARINGQNVVCVARSENGDCANDLPEQGLLFTLKPGAIPSQTLIQLMQVRANASGPVNQSDHRLYINMEEFLRTTPIDEDASTGSFVGKPETYPRTNLPKTPTSVW